MSRATVRPKFGFLGQRRIHTCYFWFRTSFKVLTNRSVVRALIFPYFGVDLNIWKFTYVRQWGSIRQKWITWDTWAEGFAHFGKKTNNKTESFNISRSWFWSDPNNYRSCSVCCVLVLFLMCVNQTPPFVYSDLWNPRVSWYCGLIFYRGHLRTSETPTLITSSLHRHQRSTHQYTIKIQKTPFYKIKIHSSSESTKGGRWSDQQEKTAERRNRDSADVS